MSAQVRNAILHALEVVGHHPDKFDIDAVIGTLEGEGIHLMTGDESIAAMFDDRCDFDCLTCHPEDQP